MHSQDATGPVTSDAIASTQSFGVHLRSGSIARHIVRYGAMTDALWVLLVAGLMAWLGWSALRDPERWRFLQTRKARRIYLAAVATLTAVALLLEVLPASTTGQNVVLSLMLGLALATGALWLGPRR